MSLPISFVWSKFGTEAGQTIGSILQRKERERVGNNGIFYWGIGNAVGPSVAALVAQTDDPEVLFSPIKSPARTEDVRPECVVTWTSATGLDGEPHALPFSSLITSRFSAGRQHHYALVCSSDRPLTDGRTEGLPPSRSIFPEELSNLLTGRPLGASQVTAVVQRRAQDSAMGTTYPVSFRARLVPPYFVRLSAPRPISGDNVSRWELNFQLTSPEVVTA
jgi:hypothetical protein